MLMTRHLLAHPVLLATQTARPAACRLMEQPGVVLAMTTKMRENVASSWSNQTTAAKIALPTVRSVLMMAMVMVSAAAAMPTTPSLLTALRLHTLMEKSALSAPVPAKSALEKLKVQAMPNVPSAILAWVST